MFKKSKKAFLEFKKVSFGYKPNKLILSDISFSIKKNQHICIIGANGCGKSTLAKIIAGLFKPNTGFIVFNGQKINKSNIKNLKNNIGIIFENPDNQFIGLSVEDDIAFGLENKCVSHNRMQSIINKIARQVGATNLLTSSVKNLSGGQKQLVALMSVLAMDPKIIIFDETTSMLDCKTKNKINKLIFNLKDKTIINITHDMDIAAKAERIIVMSKGKIVLDGTPKQIFNNPKLKTLSIDKPFSYQLIHRIKDAK